MALYFCTVIFILSTQTFAFYTSPNFFSYRSSLRLYTISLENLSTGTDTGSGTGSENRMEIAIDMQSSSPAHGITNKTSISIDSICTTGTSTSHASQQVSHFMDSFLKQTNDSTKQSKVRELLQPFLEDDLLLHTLQSWSRPLPTTALFKPLVLVGPSGVGKGRLIRSILKDYNRFFGKIVSHTTRSPRPDEKNGVHYHYISKEQFQAKVEANEFIEWAIVHGNYYGTSIQAWKDIQTQGKISIFEIDIQGARSIVASERTLNIRPKYAFIAPPNVDVLRERLDIRYLLIIAFSDH